MSDATTFDALVVGAGPAGATVAILLARAGWSVAVIERQRFPRRKVCGECIAASNLPLLQALGVGNEVAACAGPPLREVTLLHGDATLTARLPPASHELYPWGRALGRETLDGLLLQQACASGAVVFQPWSLQAIVQTAGAWHCELRAVESSARLGLRASIVIDAHGSWEALRSDRTTRQRARSASDLFAFKANFSGASLPEGAINVLALPGGYGGMVVADHGLTTVACCIRRDRLKALRSAAPGSRVGEAVEAWLRSECAGVRQALHGARREGPWLSSGPLDPGMRLGADGQTFPVGNAAGEAHPILGEGISMALQSAALLSSHLLGRDATAGDGPAAPVPDRELQARIRRRYAADWRHAFAPRMRIAALFAHVAMRPGGAAALMLLARAWPGLLTQGARWGGKTRAAEARTAARAGPDREAAPPAPWKQPREEST